MAHPIRSAYRGAMWIKDHVSAVFVKLTAVVLYRWGHRLKVPAQHRHRIYWKAGHRDIVPLAQLYDFMSQEDAPGQYYKNAPQWSSRSQTVLNALGPRLSKDDRILELGSNLGRNLNHLWQAGFKHLQGMEISAPAVRRMRTVYPALAEVPVDVAPAEASIKRYPDRSFDVVITMATLEHVHPESRFLFGEIARVARKYVLAIERPNGKRSHMQYPWDMVEEFTRVGLSLIESQPWSALWAGELTPANEWADDMQPFHALLFKTPEVDPALH